MTMINSISMLTAPVIVLNAGEWDKACKARAQAFENLRHIPACVIVVDNGASEKLIITAIGKASNE